MITVTLNDDLETGKLYVLGAGVEYDARYEMRGFDRWWFFGMNEDGTYAYGFLMQPDGSSDYYVLADETDFLGTLVRRELYSCQSREEKEQLAEEQAEEAHLRAEPSGQLDQYRRLIANRIEQNWIRPASAQPGLECEVQVIQIPSGDIVDVRVGRCNGDDAVIRSIEAAVLNASPLPRPPIPSLFERTLNVVFAPDH